MLEIDWRFLLPPGEESFRRLLLLGADEGVAERARAVGFAREVALQATAETADVVVCLRGAGATLEDVATHVAPDGVLYYEAERALGWPFGASANRLRRSARRAGLAQSRLYWVHPDFLGPRTYFPLDAPRAVEWHLGSLQIAPTLPARIVRRLLQALARRPTLLDRMVPRVAVVAVRGGPREPGEPSTELPQPLRHRGLASLVLIHGDEQSRVVALPFAVGSEVPVAVVKFHRLPDGQGGAAGEQEVLEMIRENLDERLRETIPEPLGVIRYGNVAGSVETFLAGEWLHARWARRRLSSRELRDDLQLVAEWLTEFQLAAGVETRRWSESDVRDWLERPLAAYERAFGTTDAEAQLFAEARRHSRDMLGVAIPVVWQHRDLSSLNVFRSGQTVHVIDWEGASPGPPMDDLLYFGTRWLHRARGSRRTEIDVAFRQLFLDATYRDAAVDAVRAAIRRYTAELDFDGRLLPLLIIEPWVRRAVGRFGRHATPRLSPDARDGRPDPHPLRNPRVGNRYVTYVEVLAENPEALFSFSP